jgi:hypothetical protein
MNYRDHRAVSIGATAYASVTRTQLAIIVGVTSRGLFLLTPPRRIVFVSFEHYRSPLTVNLDRSCDPLRTIEVGTTAQLIGDRLIFPSIESSVAFAEGAIWYSLPPIVESQPLRNSGKRCD